MTFKESIPKKTALFFLMTLLLITVRGQDNFSDIREPDIELNRLKDSLSLLSGEIKQMEYLVDYFDEHEVQDSLTAKFVATYLPVFIRHQHWDEALHITNILGNYYIYNKIDHKEAYNLLKKTAPFIEKCNNRNYLANFYITYAEAATYMQRYDESLRILDEAIIFMEKNKDSSLYEYGYAYLKAGENSDKINEIAKSVTYFVKAKQIFNYQNNELMYLWAQNGLAQLFSKNALYDRAKEAREEVFEKGKAIKEYQVVAIARLGACNDANLLGNREEEFSQIRKALNERNNQSDIQAIVDMLTLSYAVFVYARNAITDTSDLYKKELNNKIGPYLNNPFLSTYYTMALSHNALAHDRFDEAEMLAVKALKGVKASRDVQSIIRIEKLLGEIFEKKGLPARAIYHYKNYARIKDSVFNSVSRKKYAFVQTQFETEKKDLEIAQQKQSIALLNAENKEKTYWMLFGTMLLLSGSGFLWIYRSRKFARKKQKLTEHYSQELLLNQEREKEYISRELHDGVGQQLTLLTKKARDLNDPELHLLSQQTLEEVRAVSRGLHPPVLDSLGITEAIRQLVYGFDEKYSIIFTLELDTIDSCFDKNGSVNLYRFVQEALTNVIKHARATEVLISIRKQENILLLIKDNGDGFDFKKKRKKNSLGLKTMKERIKIMKGELHFDTTGHQGTIIKATIPCKYE